MKTLQRKFIAFNITDLEMMEIPAIAKAKLKLKHNYIL